MSVVRPSESIQIKRIVNYFDNNYYNNQNNDNNNNENMKNSEKSNFNLLDIKINCDLNQEIDNISSTTDVMKSIPKSLSAKQLTEYRTPNNQQTLSYLDDFYHYHRHHRCTNSCSPDNNNFNTSIMPNLPKSPLAGPSNSPPLIIQNLQQNNNNNTSSGGDTGNNIQNQSLIPARIKRNESNCSVLLNEELQISRRPSIYLQEIMSTRRPSAVMAAIRSPASNLHRQTKIMGSLHENPSRNDNGSFNGSTNSIGSFTHLNMTNCDKNDIRNNQNSDLAMISKRKNRRIGDDALSTALSTLYCKLLVIMGVAMPVTEIMSSKIPTHVYHGFYVYLYFGSIIFVIFVYATTCKNRTLFKILKNYHEKTNNVHIRRKVSHFGSFYLRVGAIAFGIGTMVYSGLEFGQYFELNGHTGCRDIFAALTPASRMILSIIQMQFIFLNTTELDMAKHKVIARFGLMHMVATNLCEWLYVLVEETRHEIFHFVHATDHHHRIDKNLIIDRSTTTTEDFLNMNVTINNSSIETLSKHSESEHYVNCQRTNIMGSLVQNAAPFLFPCTIEYSLICAVILYEMWKKVKSIPDIVKTRRNSMKPSTKNAHHLSVDCSRAHRGLFFGIMLTVMTIICMIMYFVLYDQPGYESFAMLEVTICETIMYSVTSLAVIAAMVKMRDLKFISKVNETSSMSLDCTLLVLAQTGVYVYGMFSIMGSYFSIADGIPFGIEGLWAEVIGLIQTSIQTLFILNACWRRCKGAQQQRNKPGRETITFLLVANVSMWFINTLIKGRAAFRKSHLEFFGVWAWTVITHVSMPLAIFYRFHSTICLFEIWKSAYKVKSS